MSSSYDSQHHEPTFCPSCGKRKANFFNNAEEKSNFQDMNPTNFKFDHNSIKHLVMLLTTLLNNSNYDKEPKKPHRECKCKNHHDKDKDEWWKHDKKHDDYSDKHDCKCKDHKDHDFKDWWNHDKKHDDHHEKHDCKCKKHKDHGHYDWWKDEEKHDKHHDKHDCGCKKHKDHEHYDWWKDEEKHDKHHDKHDCKCKKHKNHGHYDWWKDEEKHHKHHDKHDCRCKRKETKHGKNYRHFELEPNSPKFTEDEEMMAAHSSSFEFDYKPFKKAKGSKHDGCKCQERNAYHGEEESSSVEMPKKEHYHKKSLELPNKIWLSDILSLLYKHNLLNLDHLFDQLHKGKHPHKNPTCNCYKDRQWGDDNDHKKDHNKYTKEYYYNGIPLKKIKRKASPYKKYM